MTARASRETFDLAVIGGGINGCGIARDAAGRGLRVVLCEAGDLAGATSSASTKLIHGGLRYLEHREFRLVRESLAEREVLWGLAPHIIWPLRFVLPHHRGLRPAWLLRLGLFLYDHLGGRRKLPATRTLDLRTDPAGAPLKPGLFDRGFEYSDLWVDDARLVVATARDAAARGALVRTRCEVVAAERGAAGWRLAIEDARSRERETVSAAAVVNAAGPWVEAVGRDVLGLRSEQAVRLVQGSHIVVPRLFPDERPFIFQNADGRIVFAIPFERDFTLIGTTDRDHSGDPANPRAGEAEVAYLCEAASAYFTRAVVPADVVWSYSGVRPLHGGKDERAQAVTRDYLLELDRPAGLAPALSVYGGKITTYRRLAEDALNRLAAFFPEAGRAWTAGAALPGGDFPVDGVETLVAEVRHRAPWLAEREARRLVRLYGTEAHAILGEARSAPDLGRAFGGGLTEAELRHLTGSEWAETVEDVIWRRTKLGLVLTRVEVEALRAFMDGGGRVSPEAPRRGVASATSP